MPQININTIVKLLVAILYQNHDEFIFQNFVGCHRDQLVDTGAVWLAVAVHCTVVGTEPEGMG